MAKRILIVDDNAVNRKYARAVLKAEHLTIDEVEDGEKALEAVARQVYHLVLMDIQMPGMDGFECMKRMRADHPEANCPILAVTAFSNDREYEEFTAAGFQSLVPKPIRPAELKAEVNKWLEIAENRDFGNTTPSTKANGVIDLSLYEDLKKHIRSDTVIEIYEEYEKETKSFIEQLNFLVPAKNYPEILSILHTIKGNAGSLGIFNMADHTRQMEGKLREAHYEDLNRDFNLLKVQFSDFVDQYRRLLT